MIMEKSEFYTTQVLEKSKTETLEDVNDRKHVEKELREKKEN